MSELHPDPRPARDSSPMRRWAVPAIVLAVVVLAGLGAWGLWGRAGSSTGAPAVAKKSTGMFGSGKAGGRFAVDPNRAQPVAAAAARIGDVNIVQTALGTVTALRTVTVHPRVDGQLQSVLFTEGQLVKAGDVLAQIDPAPFQVALEQAEGQLARDAATLNNARLDLDRYRTLLAQDSIATQLVDQQASMVKQLEGTVKFDQAQVDNAKLQLSYTRITAPIPGRLGLRLVDAGNMVHGSDPGGLAVITQVDPITVIFAIPQDVLPRVLERLRSGDKPAVEAWDREQKNLLARGALLTTDNQIDVTTGTVKLKAQFSNADLRLFPNQFVNVRMVIDTLKGVVVVPTAAIQRGTQGTLVYVVGKDSTVSLRSVKTGATEGPATAIDSGLQAGELVITDGVDRIREGAKVEVTKPGAAPGAAQAPSDAADAKQAQAKRHGKKRQESQDKAAQ